MLEEGEFYVDTVSGRQQVPAVCCVLHYPLGLGLTTASCRYPTMTAGTSEAPLSHACSRALLRRSRPPCCRWTKLVLNIGTAVLATGTIFVEIGERTLTINAGITTFFVLATLARILEVAKELAPLLCGQTVTHLRWCCEWGPPSLARTHTPAPAPCAAS